MTLSGVTGDVRWGYMVALVFGPWRFEGGQEGGTLTGRLVSSDAFRVTQAPLVAVLQVGRTAARYPVLDVAITGSEVTATLGPREQG